MRLHPALYLVVVQVLPLMNEGLTYLVEGCIVEVLGGKGCRINGCIAWVTLANDVLFYQFHGLCLLGVTSSLLILFKGERRGYAPSWITHDGDTSNSQTGVCTQHPLSRTWLA